MLTIDIGNTHTVFGLWSAESQKSKSRNLVSTCRLSTDTNRTACEWYYFLSQWVNNTTKIHKNKIKIAIYSSVVPTVSAVLEKTYKLLKINQTIRVDHQSENLPFQFEYENYKTLGADRIANTIAGIELYGENLIIVDFGTAITFCLIVNKKYYGGVIAPGFHSALKSLSQNTAKLPEIRFQSKTDVLGKSTVESIEAGSYFGWKGLIKEILFELKNHKIVKQNKIKVIATGGISDSLGFAHSIFDVIDKNLTLKGLLKYYELTQENAKSNN